jgi:glycosyltransferase involved in cell wall biosynthesis
LHRQHKRILDLPLLVHELEGRQVPFQLTIVGDGEDRDSILDELGADRLNNGTASFLGYMPPEQIATQIYPYHDILIHLSAAEGCPQVVQQAMAHGLVPICSEFLGIHSLKFLRDGSTCCIFPVGDLGCAADRIEKLYKNPDQLALMARVGQQKMHELDITHVFDGWEQAIIDALRLPIRTLVPSDPKIPAIAPDVSRLARLGLSPGGAEWVRRTLRRFPVLSDGWAEWPGTSTVLDESTRVAILAQLHALDRAMRPVKSLTKLDA